MAKLFPLILATLLHQPLVAQTEEDERVRAWGAKAPTYPITVYKQ